MSGHPVLRSYRRARRVVRKAGTTVSRVPHPRALKADELGANYDTDWARKRSARFVRSALLTLSKPIIGVVAKPTIVNTEQLKDLKGPVIFAANHASHIDTSLVLTSLPRRFRKRAMVAAAADYFFDKQLKAAVWALWINIIPIEREKVGRRSADLAARLIGEGWNLVIFPEGTRSRDGSIAKFRGGAAYLSMRCDTPVVPVYLGGTHAILNANVRLLRPGKTRVVFGEPLQALPDEKARDYNNRIEGAVRALAEQEADRRATLPNPSWPQV